MIELHENVAYAPVSRRSEHNRSSAGMIELQENVAYGPVTKRIN